jgi:diguanylate cyclase (GGDEF)-like protein
VLAFFDHDSILNGRVNYWGLTVDAGSLAVAFVVVVLLASAMQRRHSALSLEYERVRKLAESDHLTALPNRTTFVKRLNELLLPSVLGPRGHGVLFCDLDGFKAINDANGHRIGDLLLVAIAERLRLALRGNDVVARIGGDEFAVLVEGARDRTEMATVANKLDLALLPPFTIDGRELRVHISTGFALFPADGRTAQDLLAVSDAHMYRAKRAGKTLSTAPTERSHANG